MLANLIACSFAGEVWLRVTSLRVVCQFHFKDRGGLADAILIANIFDSKANEKIARQSDKCTKITKLAIYDFFKMCINNWRTC